MTDEKPVDGKAAEEGADELATVDAERKKPTMKRRRKKVQRDLVKEADKAIATEAEKKKRRRSTRRKFAAGVVLLIVAILYYGLQPLKGTVRYGVCRTFIELKIPYPSTLQVNVVEESAQAVRIYYSHIDAFGSSRLNMIECEYGIDPQRGLILSTVSINRQVVDAEEVKSFNFSVPYILANPPDLRLPRFRSSSLADLKIDYY